MLFRKLVVTVAVLMSSLTSAFVVKSSCSLSSTWIMSSSTANNNNQGDGTIATFEQSLDSLSKKVSDNKDNVPKKNSNAFMNTNEYLLESVLIAFLMTFIIYGPVGTIV